MLASCTLASSAMPDARSASSVRCASCTATRREPLCELRNETCARNEPLEFLPVCRHGRTRAGSWRERTLMRSSAASAVAALRCCASSSRAAPIVARSASACCSATRTAARSCSSWRLRSAATDAFFSLVAIFRGWCVAQALSLSAHPTRPSCTRAWAVGAYATAILREARVSAVAARKHAVV
jgi:hypothetical protein